MSAPSRAPNFAPAPALQLERSVADASGVVGLTGPRLVFVNGRWAPELSSVADLPRGVVLQGLAAALAADPVAVEHALARFTLPGDAPFAALNDALFEDGAYVFLPRGTVLGAPIQLVFVARGDAPFETHPRIVVVAEAGSQATVLETWEGRGVAWTNAVTQVTVGDGAHVQHVRVQQESGDAFHTGRVFAVLDRAAQFTSHSLALGAALARTEIDVAFAAEGGECSLQGVYAVGDSQLSDNRTFVDHAQPHCTSQQLYKGVLAGAARGIFNGRILVRQDAQKTAAHQANRNLLLSETALVDTKPQLEIHADDVRCTHGATIGRLDAAAIFYLQSRGIGAREAEAILTEAFAREALAKVQPEPLRAALEARVAERLVAWTGGAA
jgi:Fe-S cluster assembly protein SufD